MSDGFVYFIRAEGTGSIKIGFSTNHPSIRLKELQTGSPSKLELVSFYEGSQIEENELHHEFAEERGNGEWFEESPRLKAKIKELIEESYEDKKNEFVRELNKGTILLETPDSKTLALMGKEGVKYERRYEGELKDGKPHGQGTITYSPSGEIFKGEFKDGKENGQGIWTHPDGESTEGEWKNGYIQFGTHIESDGSKYEGDFAGLGVVKHGKGTYTYPDGHTYVGEWDLNKRHGEGIMSYGSEGERQYIGQWKDDFMCGIGTLYFHEIDVKIYCEEWEKDKENGKVTKQFSNGQERIGYYKDGELDKEKPEWHIFPSGDIFIGYFDEDGDTYLNGEYYVNEKLRYKYVNGKQKKVSALQRFLKK